MATKARARTLDFSNVKESSGINPKHTEEGEYLGKIIEVRDEDSKGGEGMWTYLIKSPDVPGAVYPYYCVLNEKNLWKLRNLFIAAGIDIPKRAAKLDPNKVVGKEIGIILEDDEYEGKLKSVIQGVLPKEELADYDGAATASDEDDEDDDEEEEVPVKKSRRKAAPEPEDDEDEDDEEPEEKPVSKRTAKRRAAKAAAEAEDDEDEEEEVKPKKRKAKKRKADEDDDLDLDI